MVRRWQTLDALLEEKLKSEPEKRPDYDKRMADILHEPFTSIRRSLQRALTHEYLHHADALGFIDHDLFIEAYTQFASEESQPYASIHHTVEAAIDNTAWYYWIFGLDKTSERIAYLGAHFAADSRIECPLYLKDVYARVLTFTSPWEEKQKKESEGISFLTYRMR